MFTFVILAWEHVYRIRCALHALHNTFKDCCAALEVEKVTGNSKPKSLSEIELIIKFLRCHWGNIVHIAKTQFSTKLSKPAKACDIRWMTHIQSAAYICKHFEVLYKVICLQWQDSKAVTITQVHKCVSKYSLVTFILHLGSQDTQICWISSGVLFLWRYLFHFYCDSLKFIARDGWAVFLTSIWVASSQARGTWSRDATTSAEVDSTCVLFFQIILMTLNLLFRRNFSDISQAFSLRKHFSMLTPERKRPSFATW